MDTRDTYGTAAVRHGRAMAVQLAGNDPPVTDGALEPLRARADDTPRLRQTHDTAQARLLAAEPLLAPGSLDGGT